MARGGRAGLRPSPQPVLPRRHPGQLPPGAGDRWTASSWPTPPAAHPVRDRPAAALLPSADRRPHRAAGAVGPRHPLPLQGHGHRTGRSRSATAGTTTSSGCTAARWPRAPRSPGMACFYNEKVDLIVDGVPQERPSTPFSSAWTFAAARPPSLTAMSARSRDLPRRSCLSIPGSSREDARQGPRHPGRHGVPRPRGRRGAQGEGGGAGQGRGRHPRPGVGRQGPLRPRQRLVDEVDGLRRHGRGRRRRPAPGRDHGAEGGDARPRSWPLDLLLAQVEQAAGLPVGHIGIEAQIETARGLINVEEICAASPRLETIIFGPADFAASMEMPVLTGGVQIPDYPGDHFHYVFSKILMAGRANGLQVIDGPYLYIRDPDGFRDYCKRTRHARLRRQVGAAPRPGDDPQRGVLAHPGAVRPGLGHPRGLPGRRPRTRARARSCSATR